MTSAWRLYFGIVLCAVVGVQPQSLISRLFGAIDRSPSFMGIVPEVMVELGNADSRKNLRAVHGQNRLQPPLSPSEPFPCKTEGFRSPTRPTNVNQLRPGDIDVVAAIGDSMTAGNGGVASNMYQVLIENKGVSFPIGGQGNWRKYLTVPNILKEFNPHLKGYSFGSGMGYSNKSGLNTAFGGALDEHLLRMAKDLVTKIKEDKTVDFEEDWKVVTILSGANNLCTKMCNWWLQTTSEDQNHKKMLQLALDYLQTHLPRTIVNLLAVENVAQLREFTNRPAECELMKFIECSCFFNPLMMLFRDQLTRVVKDFHDAERSLIESGRYDRTDDFTVVLQPFFSKINIPTVMTHEGNITDYTYLSHDCFHLSQKGHARAANALWNNMLQPVGQKSLGTQETYKHFLCPTEESPYIFTNVNSKRFIKEGRQ